MAHNKAIGAKLYCGPVVLPLPSYSRPECCHEPKDIYEYKRAGIQLMPPAPDRVMRPSLCPGGDTERVIQLGEGQVGAAPFKQRIELDRVDLLGLD